MSRKQNEKQFPVSVTFIHPCIHLSTTYPQSIRWAPACVTCTGPENIHEEEGDPVFKRLSIQTGKWQMHNQDTPVHSGGHWGRGTHWGLHWMTGASGLFLELWTKVFLAPFDWWPAFIPTQPSQTRFVLFPLISINQISVGLWINLPSLPSLDLTYLPKDLGAHSKYPHSSYFFTHWGIPLWFSVFGWPRAHRLMAGLGYHVDTCWDLIITELNKLRWSHPSINENNVFLCHALFW